MSSIESVEHAVVLAGGRSSRMGRSKAFLDVGGETMARRLVLGLDRLFDTVSLSIAAPSSSEEDPELTRLVGAAGVCHDEFPDRGPLEGVRSSLRALTVEFAFFIAVDTPLVWVPLVRALVRSAEDSGRGAVPRFAGRLEPGFAVYSRTLLDDIESAFEAGETRLQSMADWDGVAVLDLDDSEGLEGRDVPAELFWSVNTPEEYDRLLQAMDSGPVSRDPIIF